jgi:hypothetical protein
MHNLINWVEGENKSGSLLRNRYISKATDLSIVSQPNLNCKQRRGKNSRTIPDIPPLNQYLFLLFSIFLIFNI